MALITIESEELSELMASIEQTVELVEAQKQMMTDKDLVINQQLLELNELRFLKDQKCLSLAESIKVLKGLNK